MGMVATIKNIEKALEDGIKKETGADVSVTMRGPVTWTISGEPSDAEKAGAFVIAHDLMVLEEMAFSEELGLHFMYFRTGTQMPKVA